MDIDHDQIHKTLIELFLREFLELFCPQASRAIDFRHVEFLKQEYFTDTPRGRRKVMDLVVKVRLIGGGQRYILIHFEFEASRKEKDFPRQMFKRFCTLFTRHDRDVLPIAVFTDDAKWRKRVPDFFEIVMPGKNVVRFGYHLVKLKHLDHRRFLTSENPLAYALMAKMDYNRKERVRLKADFLRLILGAKVDEARESVLWQYVETYMPLDEAEEQEFEKIVAVDEQYEEVAEVITVYEQRGIETGQLQANQRTLIRLLERKFGKLDTATKRRIREIESNRKLDRLLLKVVDAETLDAIGL